MGKGLKQMFLQRRYTNHQQAHESIFNFINLQGNAKTQRDSTSLPVGWLLYLKKKKMQTENKCK